MTAKFVKTRLAVLAVMSIAIPAIASIEASDVSPQKLSESSSSYILSVCVIVLAGTVVSLFYTMMRQSTIHRKELHDCYGADRADRQSRDEKFGELVKSNTEAMRDVKVVMMNCQVHK